MKAYVKYIALLTILLTNNFYGQQIWHPYVPAWGHPTENLLGKVNVNPAQHRIASYIFAEEADGWWTKPTFANPTVPILSDSTFVLNFTTGGIDNYCTRIITFLIPIDYSPPQAAGMPELPQSLFPFPYYISVRPHGDRVIEWSGLEWIVNRSVNGAPVGPDPNIFSSEETHVFIDENDNLHLSLKSNKSNQWLCSEVIADNHLHAYKTDDNSYYMQPTGMLVAKEAFEMFEDQIEEQAGKENFFTIYPNPTTGILTLEITNQDLLQKPIVHVFSIFGENILQQIFTGRRTHELNLSEQPPGLYFVRVIIGEKTQVFKII